MVAVTDEDPLGPSFIEKLPEELHDMLSAGLANAVKRVVESDSILPFRPFGYDGDSEGEIDGVASYFMEELAKPAPQMERFIRHNRLRKNIYEYEGPTRMEVISDYYDIPISVEVAHRIFEQEIYDYGRSLGLSKEQATGHVYRARADSSKVGVDLMELGNYDSNECENVLNYLHAHSEQLLAEKNTKEAKQVKRYLQTLKDNGSHSEYDDVMIRLKFDGNEHSVYRSLIGKIADMEAADQTKNEKTAGKESRKAHKAKLRAQKRLRRWVDKRMSQQSTELQARMMPKEQNAFASIPEQPAQFQAIAGREEPSKRKKKGRKLKSELALPMQLGEPPKEHIKHKKGKVGRAVQDAVSKKAKRKRDVGPQHSPFFQRSSNPKVKKDAVMKAEQLMDFQSPMIQ